ncbi:MAG: molybdopterin-binding protein, partial [Acidobacteriota bacterium]|nr:molybdopterin-binding protein [Acidobacteriota bacterium]
VARGEKEDRAGLAVAEQLRSHGVVVERTSVLPDEAPALREEAQRMISSGVDLVVAVGGTGVGRRDVTVDALSPLIDRELPGVMEAARAHGQKRTRFAMLSRGVAGLSGSTLLVTVPGSTRGAVESCHVLFPPLLHVLEVLRERPHEQDDR